MKKILILFAILFSVCICSEYLQLLEQEQGIHRDLFDAFAQKYEKKYLGDKHTYDSLITFKNNMNHMKLHQSKDRHGKYGITRFSDISPEQFEQQYLTLPYHLIDELQIPIKSRKLGLWNYLFGYGQIDVSQLPKNFDWREKGVITEAKQQEGCGSCWAFATTGIIEAQYAIKYNKLQSFSEQYLIDCDTNDQGCHGGLMTNAYKYLKNHKIPADKDYGEYLHGDNECHANEKSGLAKVVNYYQIEKDEKYIQRELHENGPIAVGVNARFLQFYVDGIHNPEECTNQINHAVLLVGYGESDEGVPYWIVKNTWGKHWGDNGYFKLLRGQQKCGVHTYASIAFIE